MHVILAFILQSQIHFCVRFEWELSRHLTADKSIQVLQPKDVAAATINIENYNASSSQVVELIEIVLFQSNYINHYSVMIKDFRLVSSMKVSKKLLYCAVQKPTWLGYSQSSSNCGSMPQRLVWFSTTHSLCFTRPFILLLLLRFCVYFQRRIQFFFFIVPKFLHWNSRIN